MKTPDTIRTASQADVWRSAENLLARMRFSTEKGTARRNELVAITVMPYSRWLVVDEDKAQGDLPEPLTALFNVVVTVSQRQGGIPLESFAVVLFGKDIRGCLPLRPQKTDRRGQVVFKDLCPGEYWFAHPRAVWAPPEAIPFRSPASGLAAVGGLAAAPVRTRGGREPLLRFPEEPDMESPLVCVLDEGEDGEYILSANLRIDVEDTLRVVYAIVEEPSEKIATMTQEGKQIELRGVIPLQKRSDGTWSAEIGLGPHLEEALAIFPEGPRYRLRCFVVCGQEQQI